MNIEEKRDYLKYEEHKCKISREEHIQERWDKRREILNKRWDRK